MDQSNRYADLSLKEADLIAGGKHILVAYKMKPKAGYGYLEAAAHLAAESSTGTNVEVSTTDDFTKGLDPAIAIGSLNADDEGLKTLVIEASGSNAGGSSRYGTSPVVAVREIN